MQYCLILNAFKTVKKKMKANSCLTDMINTVHIEYFKLLLDKINIFKIKYFI